MKSVLCPNCGAPSVLVSQKPFCAKCGWNLAAARSAVRGEVVGMWVSIVAVGLLALLFMAKKGGGWGMAASAAFMTCIVLGYYLLALLPAQKTLRAAAERFGAKAPEQDGFEQLGTELGRMKGVPPDLIARVSRPRVVRIRWRKVAGRLRNRAFAGGAAFAIFGVFFLATTRGNSLGASSAFPAIGLVFLFYLGFRILKGIKRYRILQNGEVAVGRVLSQERAGEWKQSSKITYEFEDLMGEPASGAATDMTESLYEGMPVVVFYQADDVGATVVLCETFFGIAVGGGDSILDS